MSIDLDKLEKEAVAALAKLPEPSPADVFNALEYSRAISLRRIADELRRVNDREDKLALTKLRDAG